MQPANVWQVQYWRKIMKDATRKMLEEISEAHDWQDGQTYGGSGTQLRSTDTCRACSLRRHYFSDRQNGVAGEYRFSDGETGQDLSMRQAHSRGC